MRVKPQQTRRTQSNIFCSKESWLTKRRRMRGGVVRAQPATAIHLGPILSETFPTKGPVRAGMARHMKMRPALREDQEKRCLT